MWDSLAEERSEKFNENPSMNYLKDVEVKTVKDEKKWDYSKVPDALKPADLDKNGYITADEISKTIDGFFEGANDFSVDKINQLIDYFFEQ
jgi:hypothetical protein